MEDFTTGSFNSPSPSSYLDSPCRGLILQRIKLDLLRSPLASGKRLHSTLRELSQTNAVPDTRFSGLGSVSPRRTLEYLQWRQSNSEAKLIGHVRCAIISVIRDRTHSSAISYPTGRLIGGPKPGRRSCLRGQSPWH